MLGALAEFERSLITDRTRAGLAAAKRRGVKVGRKPKLTGRRLEQARKMIAAGQPVAEAAQVSRATLYRALQAAT
jgi:DNA invertase Pin-like site-specific DNA recombinase